ncbi:transcriptional regulator, LysR family domain protein [Burkholderia thailandensis MSMB59]|nr:transcriptional regulator, LysR family domain protein [Burkholderia thailandensis MSMB59]
MPMPARIATASDSAVLVCTGPSTLISSAPFGPSSSHSFVGNAGVRSVRHACRARSRGVRGAPCARRYAGVAHRMLNVEPSRCDTSSESGSDDAVTTAMSLDPSNRSGIRCDSVSSIDTSGCWLRYAVSAGST